MIAWCRKTEGILETVGNGRIALQEILQALRQTGYDHNGIILPLVHLHEQFVKGIYLIGVLVWQKFLHIVKKQDTTLGLLDIIVPFVHKPLIVNSIDHRQFWLLNNLMLVEIVTEDLSEHGLTCSRLANDDGINGNPDFSNILAGLKIGIGVDDSLQLLLHFVKPYQTI